MIKHNFERKKIFLGSLFILLGWIGSWDSKLIVSFCVGFVRLTMIGDRIPSLNRDLDFVVGRSWTIRDHVTEMHRCRRHTCAFGSFVTISDLTSLSILCPGEIKTSYSTSCLWRRTTTNRHSPKRRGFLKNLISDVHFNNTTLQSKNIVCDSITIWKTSGHVLEEESVWNSLTQVGLDKMNHFQRLNEVKELKILFFAQRANTRKQASSKRLLPCDALAPTAQNRASARCVNDTSAHRRPAAI